MTLTQLRYLVAISQAGLNITAAAERVHATQPGLSKQLRQLEDELGFQFFTRKGKSLHKVTPAGKQVIERATLILTEARNIRALAANVRGNENGELIIATTHTQARFVLPSAIKAFRQRYTDVVVHLQPHGDAQVMNVLEHGQADLAILSTSGAAPGADLAVPLYRWRRRVTVPCGHPLTRLARPLELTDLDNQPLVSYESSLRADSSLRRAFRERDMQPRFACTSPDADLIKTYVRAGLGIGILAEMALGASDTDLHVLEADGLFPECTTWLVVPRDRILRSCAAALAGLIAPRIDARDLQRAVVGEEPEHWPEPPIWVDLRQSECVVSVT